MPGWLIIIIVFVVGGAIYGFFASDKDDERSGCLLGALTGGIGGIGCLGVILETIIPFVLAILLFDWLFNGCS